ncbi:MAG: ATP-dependent RNA helicase HrpA, partial [Pseudomonadales bacterium]|nr:ATP-dependent RNA helicase HrpA [Pseudomonadales bacterium]
MSVQTIALDIDLNKPLHQQSWFCQQQGFNAKLQACMVRDRFWLSKQRHKILQQENPDADLSARWLDRFIASAEMLQQRSQLDLAITYPEQLPISLHQAKIKSLIAEHQVVVIAGETGSGKTTQIPKIALELGLGRQGKIAHTQPRRVAATAVARRLAEELGVSLGSAVGYQIRFQDNSSDQSLVKLMTDGVLLAEIAHDRFLEQYDCIIIDEAHERSLNIDFLLGYLRQILPKRPDLKVIITSATIDTDRFAQHFFDAPVVQVEGRSFPVDIVYQLAEDATEQLVLADAVIQALTDIASEEREQQRYQNGDVLVFLPGEGEIRELSKQLRHFDDNQLEVLPLYARLSAQEQQKILSANPHNHIRRVVLATNVAETSLTVPGIRYVIDSGLARVSRYSHRSKVQQLPVEKISQAAANQRAGRCGRVAAGVCYRLYSAADFDHREPFTQPEIQRTNLSQVILQMQSLRIGDVSDFPFLEPPDKRLVNDGFKQLFEIGALQQNRKITPLGRKLAKLPIDPALARIVIQADKESCLAEILIIVAALAIQDPREYPQDKREQAQQKHSVYKHPESDFLALLKLWQLTEEQRQALSKNQFKRWCSKHFLSPQRLHEWRELHRQLLGIIRDMQFTQNRQAADAMQIHRALLSGFITQLGFQHQPRVFLGTRNREFRIFPSSYVGRKAPKWIMSAQLIETSQLFAHKVGKIEPEWVEQLAPHLIKYHYSEPHFSSTQGQVLVWQQAAIYGLQLSEKKRVSYAKVDKALAREIFIRDGLVAEQLQSSAKFYQHNKALRAAAEQLEEKTRRRDIVANDEEVYQFYAAKLDESVVNRVSLERFCDSLEAGQSRLLFADESLFTQQLLSDDEVAQFPDEIEWQGVSYPLQYQFNPGKASDGLSITVPLESLNRVPRFLFEWLVPGMLADKVEALLKCLPKSQRKQLVPIPNTVNKILPQLSAKDEPLHKAIADAVLKTIGVTIKADDFQLESLDDYYRATIIVAGRPSNKSETATLQHAVKKSNKNKKNRRTSAAIIDQSKDLAKLIHTHGDKVKQQLNQQLSKINQGESKIETRWVFGEIQTEQLIASGTARICAYPALQDMGKTGVQLVLTDYPHLQQSMHMQGVCRLALLQLNDSVKYLRKQILRGNSLALSCPAEIDMTELADDLLLSAAKQVFFAEHLPFRQEDFTQLLQKHRSQLTETALALDKMVAEVFAIDHTIRQQMTKLSQAAYTDSLVDIQSQR